jgi:MFS superfamily sulfate permease-like transporter
MKFNYSWGKTRNDLLAGVTVTAISLPQAMAYALIAGVDPRFGLYSAIVVTLVASIFGSSSHLINGPTGLHVTPTESGRASFPTLNGLDPVTCSFISSAPP